MMNVFYALLKKTTANPGRVLLWNALLFLVCLLSLPGIKILNTTDNFLLNDADKKYYDELKKEFKNNEFFLVGVSAQNIFTPENLETIKNITDSLERIPGVQEVRSLSSVDYIEGGESDFTIRSFLKKQIPHEERELLELKNNALKEKFYVPGLLSADGRTAGIIGFVDEHTKENHLRKQVMDQVQEVLHEAKGQNRTISFHVLGWTVTDVALSDMMMGDLGMLFPLCFSIMILSIFVIFKSVRLAFVASLCMLASTLGTLSAFSLTGITINNLTGAVLPLCLSMALADIVHLLSNLNPDCLLKHDNNGKEALFAVQKKIVLPCLFTSITTACGFLSLMSCGLASMRDFACISSMSMLFEFYFTFFLAPQLLLLFTPQNVFVVASEEDSSFMAKMLLRWTRFIRRQSRNILAVSSAVLIIAAIYVFQVPVETDLISYLKRDHPLRQAVLYVEPKLGGTNNFNISLTSEYIDEFKKPAILIYLEKLQRHIENIHDVSTAHSIVDFLKDMNQSFYNESSEYYVLPESRNLIDQYLLLYDGKDLKDFINVDFNHARIVVRILPHSLSRQSKVLKDVKDWISSNPPPASIKVRVTGDAVNNVNTAHTLVDGQIKSFAIALVMVGAMLAFAFRSMSWGVFSLMPNIIPVICMFGIMGLFHIPLDTGTIMVASISLGIACDDTLHFIFHYRSQRALGSNVSNALVDTIVTKGNAIIISSIILCLGFAVLTLSSFVPIIYFGLLSSVTMLSALFADMAVLPSILYFFCLGNNKEHRP